MVPPVGDFIYILTVPSRGSVENLPVHFHPYVRGTGKRLVALAEKINNMWNK